MCRLDIGMKLPNRSTRDFSTFNFQDVLMLKTSLIVWLFCLQIFPLNVFFNYLWMAQIPTGVYLQCFTVIVVKRIIQELLILDLMLNCFCFCGIVDWRKGFMPCFQLGPLLRLQIGFWIRSWKLCGKSLMILWQDETPTLTFVK